MKTIENNKNDWQSGLKIAEKMKRAAIEKSKKLSPLAGKYTWSGTIFPETLGPDSPEARMSGWTDGMWVNDGLYLHVQGDYQYNVEGIRGSFWKFDFLIGFDPRVQRYRQWLADNIGMAIKECTVIGNKLIVDFPPDMRIESGGHTILFRQTYDWTEPNVIGNKFETKIDQEEWKLVADLTGSHS